MRGGTPNRCASAPEVGWDTPNPNGATWQPWTASGRPFEGRDANQTLGSTPLPLAYRRCAAAPTIAPLGSGWVPGHPSSAAEPRQPWQARNRPLRVEARIRPCLALRGAVNRSVYPRRG